MIRLPHPTSSTQEIIKYAESGLKAIFMFVYHYAHFDVTLTDLVTADYRQMGVSTKRPNEQLIRLSRVIDKVNKRYGHDTLRIASQLYNAEWPMKPQWLTPRYTTQCRRAFITT